MALSSNREFSERFRDAVEKHLGAPIREARREWNRLGYMLYAENGGQMFLGDRDCERLGIDGRHDFWRFAPRLEVRYGGGGGFNMSTSIAQAQIYMNRAYDQMMRNIEEYSWDVAPGNSQPVPTDMKPKVSAVKAGRVEPKPKSLKKLYWHRYSKIGKKPL